MENNKKYTARQVQLARFTKALGHLARISILQFLEKRDTYENPKYIKPISTF
ncbi:MAG: hypothetical protein LKF48_05580 [Prevotella sp.]|jgi:hypothetical protein|nr:hypothetical protein [Prevotella sp.]MCH4182623.1 hypothetical protein [Prevotella sp.]MCH4211986.1 hypothetical protein [Prevotella sp.]MCH4241275.1 hypothetical protein [Prevotella sp.]MCI1741684.1 hypothetical protein [Prevotella sp.]